MKRIDEKVAISGDGAELIQSYLNELNMKLLAVGITDSYSIVMEAETLFISEISELNKTSKVTIYEVQKMIEKHGTPDEIVSRYLKTSEAERDEAFYSMDPETKELIKRQSNPQVDFAKIKDMFYKNTGIVILFIPPFMLFLALLRSNQYRDDFILNVILRSFTISRYAVQPFIVISFILIILNEILTGLNGKLFISLRNTIRVRTFNRTLITLGAFSSYVIKRFYESDPWIDRDLLNYNETTTNLWIFAFFAAELTILTRDHIASFYPLQPRFTPIEYFAKLPYIILLLSVALLVASLSEYNETIVIACLTTTGLATVISGMKKYRVSLRFYSMLMIISLIISIAYKVDRSLIYLNLILIFLINIIKYNNEIQKTSNQVINLVK